MADGRWQMVKKRNGFGDENRTIGKEIDSRKHTWSGALANEFDQWYTMCCLENSRDIHGSGVGEISDRRIEPTS